MKKKVMYFVLVLAIALSMLFFMPSKVAYADKVGCNHDHWTKAMEFYQGELYFCYFAGSSCAPCVTVLG
ncbi:MAG: hypothetical protein R6V04_09995 [bacterium]